MSTVAFIGLGNMGLPMAVNLQKAGYQVTGYDVVASARSAAVEAGLSISYDALSAVRDSAVTVTMLPDGAIAQRVAADVLDAMPDDSLLIDCSTIDVKTARMIHDAAKKAGKHSLDAPVSGGVVGAEAGTLTFMAGGTADAYARSQPLLDVMGQKAVHCGDGGAGQAAKICNNMLLAISMIGTCEAFSLAEKLNLDQHRLFDVISTSSGSCWSVNTYCPVPDVGPASPADNGYQPGFAAALMLKDLNLAMAAAADADASTPMGTLATNLYQSLNALGHGGDDFSAIINRLADLEC
jgi:3-hydroxyisobutyrate dehydrogenase